MKRKLLYTAFLTCVLVSGCVGPVGHLNPLDPSSGEVSEISSDAHSEIEEISGTLNQSSVDSEVTLRNLENGWKLVQEFEGGENRGTLEYDGEGKVWKPSEPTEEEQEEPEEDEVIFGETKLEEGESVTVFVGESLLDEGYSLVVTQEDDEELVELIEQDDLEEEVEIELEEGKHTARVVNMSEETVDNEELSNETETDTVAEDTAQVGFGGSDEGALPSGLEGDDATVVPDMAETLRNMEDSEYSLGSVTGGDEIGERATYQIRLTRDDGTDRRVHVDRENWYPLSVSELEEVNNDTDVKKMAELKEVEFEYK
jgi:hypothetical protein